MIQKRHLRIVVPLAFHEGIRDYCIQVFQPHLSTTTLSGSFLLQSQSSTVSDYDQYQNAPWILKAVQAAYRDGCDGVFLDVAFDTALSAAKSIVPIPVVGALESAVAYARTICSRFSILAINDEEVFVNHRLSREYSFSRQLASVETVDIPVLALRDDPQLTLSRLEKAAHQAMEAGAHAVILGCTAMSWATVELQERLPIPVLDTNLIGLYMLDSMVSLGIRASRREYRTPSGIVPLTDDEYQEHQEITFAI